MILNVQPRLRLVVLNSCDGARGDPSVAQALVRARIPAVVAMQFAVSDRAALSFSQSFYGAMAARKPMDRAISEARNAMAVERIEEWGTPVLAMRSPDGHLFKRSRREALAVAARKTRAILSKRKLTIALLCLVLMAFCLVLGVWRWTDPNLLFSLLNPRDCPSPAGIPIAFVKIKPGNFVMGSDLAPEEEPPHEVTINRPFCISRFEVTESLWHKVMNENRRRSARLLFGAARVTQLKHKGEVTYIGLEMGMDSLIRSPLYRAYHSIYNLSCIDEPSGMVAHVVGPICETGDILGHSRRPLVHLRRRRCAGRRSARLLFRLPHQRGYASLAP